MSQPATSFKIDAFAHSDGPGGAGKAALNSTLAAVNYGMAASLYVVEKTSGHPFVHGVDQSNLFHDLKRVFRLRLENTPTRRAIRPASAMFSTGFMAGVAKDRFAQSSADIMHLHWSNGATLGVETLSACHKPIVWTLHDMWPMT